MADSDLRQRHGADSQTWLTVAMLGTLFALASACGASDSEVDKPGTGGSSASAGTGGTSATGGMGGSSASGGTGGAGGKGGSNGSGGGNLGGDAGAGDRGGSAGTSNEAGTGGAASGAGGAGAGGAAGDACEPLTAFTQAWHSVANVTWPAGTATVGGTGVVHLWGKTVFSANGNTLTGTLQACGSVLPPTEVAAVAGGGRVLIQIPEDAWDKPDMPRFELDVSQSGWDVGSTLTYSYTALVGFEMADAASAPWPSSYTGIAMTNDPDGDTNAGLTATPKNGDGYVLPPTSILGVIGGARADEVHIVMRNVVSTTLTRTSCDEASGSAAFMYFDNHVVGCHVSGGDECSENEVEFIDQNRTIYEVMSATTESKTVPDDATCAEVRAALPI